MLPVMVEPATRDTVIDAIESNNVIGAEESVEEETDHTSDTVLSEHIHTIVDANPELN